MFKFHIFRRACRWNRSRPKQQQSRTRRLRASEPEDKIMLPNPNDLSSTRANGFYRRRPRARPRLCTCLILYPFSRIHFRFSSDLSSSVQPNNSIDLSITRSVKLFFPFFISSSCTRIIIKASVLKNPRARECWERRRPLRRW